MKRAAFAVPGSLDTPTGGYAYDRRIIAELGHLGWHIEVVDGITDIDGFAWVAVARFEPAVITLPDHPVACQVAVATPCPGCTT